MDPSNVASYSENILCGLETILTVKCGIYVAIPMQNILKIFFVWCFQFVLELF